MKITIDYGRTGLDIDVPDRNLRAILGLSPAPPLADPESALRAALRSPIQARPLMDIARGRTDACILICDITRPVPNEPILRTMLPLLHEAGIPENRITLLVATGLHRPSTRDEIIEMVGAEIASAYRIESHEARDLGSHVSLGPTSDGAPIYLDQRYVAADLKITVGLIEPHLMAGYSGGRKLICPGIAAAETIRHFHGYTLMKSPLATAGVVEGNPVHSFSLHVARKAGCDFIVNTALNEDRQITGIFAGEMDAAWMAGVEHVRSIARAPLDEPVDIVITSSAGYPLDTTFYQSVKGLTGALPAVKTGGTIIMAASLSGGLGGPEMIALLDRYDNIEDFMADVANPDFFRIDQWQIQHLGQVKRRAHVAVYSDHLSPVDLNRGFVEAAPSPEAAIHAALQRHGPDSTIAVIPRGPYVIPYIR